MNTESLLERNKINKTIFLIFFLSILIQSVQIYIGFSSVRLYMIVAIIYSIVFMRHLSIRKLFLYEFFYIFLYLYITISGLYAMEYKLALQIIVGQLIILISYFLGRYLIGLFTLSEFENLFVQLGKIFIIVSLILYLIGVFDVYILGNSKTVIGAEGITQTYLRTYGLYIEGGIFPRFKGLADSPNNFVYYGSIFLFYFYYKCKRLMFYITLITLLLTLSSTFYAILPITMFFYSIYRHKFFYYIIGIIAIVAITFILYNMFPSISDMLDYRLARTMTGSGRFELWSYVLNKISEEPILGYGANQSRIIIAPLRDLMSTHNTFLEVFISAGIGGAMIFIFFISSMFDIIIKLVRKMKDPLLIVLFINYIFFISANNSLHIDPFYYLIIFAYASKLLIKENSV